MSQKSSLNVVEIQADKVSHADMANAISALSMDAVQKANSGHPGMPMGMADVATVLFSKFLKFDASQPEWSDRDRFILSAGHGSMLLYSLLYLTGYTDIDLEQLKNFRQLGARTCGHPEFGEAEGIETTTGPLGQGLANAVGMALAEKMQAARYGDDIVDHYTYVIAGDGCLMEGISHEAISLAGHLKLEKLIVLFDDNNICIDGPTSMTVSDNQLLRFKASGWDVCEVDGHDPKAIELAIDNARKSEQPSLVACKTTIAKGSPTKAGTSSSHGSPLGEEEISGAKAALGWEHEPFYVPEDVLEAWRAVGQKGQADYTEWQTRFAQLDAIEKNEFNRLQKGELPAALNDTIMKLKQEFTDSGPMATRKSSGLCLEEIAKAVPELIGGSADLTGSNLTKTSGMLPVTADDFLGRYVYYGVREHAMCAAMNGMALHGGFIPYGGTFFVFTDYCRPAIRMAALMKQRVIFVMTHDSIGLGEDGPTHQPVEHLAAMRAMPNVDVYRPADAIETAECWQLALEKNDGPSMLVLTRQGVMGVRGATDENVCAKGGYVLREIDDAKVTLIATGSEIGVAIDAQQILDDQGIPARVVSLPCAERFDAQSDVYKKSVLGEGTLKVGIEAATDYGWGRYIGNQGIFVGMNGFGASGPAGELYKHFGITAEDVVKRVKEAL